MFLFYTFGDVTESHREAPQTLTKFGIATLERFATGFSLSYHRVLTGACGRVIGTLEREVPCITIGLCNKKCYKCEERIINAVGVLSKCLIP
jgi:hypothetical protein